MIVWPKTREQVLSDNKLATREAAQHSDQIRVRLAQLENETTKLKQDVKETKCKENSSTT